VLNVKMINHLSVGCLGFLFDEFAVVVNVAGYTLDKSAKIAVVVDISVTVINL